jgi:hypothetical protein
VCAFVVFVAFHVCSQTWEASLDNDKSSSERKMIGVVDYQQIVRRAAEPCPAGDSVKAAIGRAARRLRWKYTRTRAFWYADERINVKDFEADQLRSADKEQSAGPVNHEVLARLESVEQMLRALASRLPQDEDFYRAQANLIGDAARVMGRADHSG